MKLLVSRDAEADIARITRYTHRNWGADQARIYVGGLIEAIEKLSELPDRGRPTDGVPEHYLKIKYQSHNIFYRVSDGSLVIARILHHQMDFGRHLN